jgi:hypothetical protein
MIFSTKPDLIHLGSMPAIKSVSYLSVGRISFSFSGAELANIISKALAQGNGLKDDSKSEASPRNLIPLTF